MTEPTRVELGCAGHFVGAPYCNWRLHTQLTRADGTGFRVSTVGEYYPDDNQSRRPVGSGDDDYFETKVFALGTGPAEDNDGCGCRRVNDWHELACRRYATAGEAQRGHEAVVAEYLARLRAEKEE